MKTESEKLELYKKTLEAIAKSCDSYLSLDDLSSYAKFVGYKSVEEYLLQPLKSFRALVRETIEVAELP